MRKIDKVIIHCSGTPKSRYDDIKVIDKWHRKRGWDGVGYHVYLKRDGTCQEGRPFSKIGAHCYGQNSTSLGFCMGGLDKFTVRQKIALFELIDVTLDVYNLSIEDVYCHNYFNKSKLCPGFDTETLHKEFIKWISSKN